MSNHIKALEDLLVEGGVIEDDSYVMRLTVQWGDVPVGAHITIASWKLDGLFAERAAFFAPSELSSGVSESWP